MGGWVGDLGRDYYYLGFSRVDMGSWVRAGGGCILYSGGCIVRGLGSVRVEVLLGGRKVVGIGKGRKWIVKWLFYNVFRLERSIGGCGVWGLIFLIFI